MKKSGSLSSVFNTSDIITYSQVFKTKKEIDQIEIDNAQEYIFAFGQATEIELNSEEILNSVLTCMDINSDNFNYKLQYASTALEDKEIKSKVYLVLRFTQPNYEKLKIIMDKLDKEMEFTINVILSLFNTEMKIAFKERGTQGDKNGG